MKDAYIYPTFDDLKALGIRFINKEYESAVLRHFNNWWNNYQVRYYSRRV